MNSSKLADVSEILSSVAIVFTLIYLAIEINQNTEALHAQSRQAVLASSQAELFQFMDNPEMLGYFVNQEALSADESVKFHMYLVAIMRVREFSWLQFRSGAIDETQWATEYNILQVVLSTDRTRKWWFTMGRPAFGPEFAEFVDSAIRDYTINNEFREAMQTWTNQQN